MAESSTIRAGCRALSSARWHQNRWSDVVDQRLNRYPRFTRSRRLGEPERQNSSLSGRDRHLSFEARVAALCRSEDTDPGVIGKDTD